MLQGPLRDLLTRTGGLYFEVDKPVESIEVLAAAGVKSRAGGEDGTIWADVGPERAGELNSMLVGAGLVVSGLGARSADLESVFLEVTGDDDAGVGMGD